MVIDSKREIYIRVSRFKKLFYLFPVLHI